MPPPDRVEILIIDTSGSMGSGDKFAGARRATLAALDVLPDGTRFAIVEGTDKAEVVYPGRARRRSPVGPSARPPGTRWTSCARTAAPRSAPGWACRA